MSMPGAWSRTGRTRQGILFSAHERMVHPIDRLRCILSTLVDLGSINLSTGKDNFLALMDWYSKTQPCRDDGHSCAAQKWMCALRVNKLCQKTKRCIISVDNEQITSHTSGQELWLFCFGRRSWMLSPTVQKCFIASSTTAWLYFSFDMKIIKCMLLYNCV